MKLRDREYVLAAWPESCEGPGWANELVVVIVAGVDGNSDKMRREYLQPSEWCQIPGLRDLYRVAEAAKTSFTACVRVGCKDPAR